MRGLHQGQDSPAQDCKPEPYSSQTLAAGPGVQGRQGLLAPVCRRTNRSPGALPPLTPRLPPLTALCLVICWRGWHQSGTRTWTWPILHPSPNPAPAPAQPKALKGPDCAWEVSELDEYMKGCFVQVGRSGGWGLRGRRAAFGARTHSPMAPTWAREGSASSALCPCRARLGPLKRPSQGNNCPPKHVSASLRNGRDEEGRSKLHGSGTGRKRTDFGRGNRPSKAGKLTVW